MNRRTFLTSAAATAGAIALPALAQGSQPPTPKGVKVLFQLPPDSGHPVSMCFMNGRIFVACGNAVYYINEKDIE